MSRPHKASNAKLSGLVLRANLVLRPEIRLISENQNAISAYKGVTTSIQSASLFNAGLYPGT